MEYHSKFDFYLKFKPEYDEGGKFLDYILIYVSDSFVEATNISKQEVSNILGKKFSEILLDLSVLNIDIKKLYFKLNPKAKIKYELYIEDLNRWYLINAFTDKGNGEETIVYYTDITDLKEREQSLFGHKNDKIYYLRDREKLLYRDKLTGLYNKCFFEEELSRLDTKRQLPISIIMGDINGLKLINDAFGHNMGDRALKKVADIMAKSFREEDIISRAGGDEFYILLPKTVEATALEIVDRVKGRCKSNPLEFIQMSVSFGVATKTSSDEDMDKIVKTAENRMYFNKLKESKEAKFSMIEFLKERLEKITYETKSHYDRLKDLTHMMAEELNLSEIERKELYLLCEFHDIGKIGVPKEILQKEGQLNDEEWESVKRHSEIGYYIAKEIRNSHPIDELILTHHERWDGKGYPGLLKKDEIPLVARIFAIADAYDMMVNDRPFQSRITEEAALEEIRRQSGRQFDPRLAKIFVRLMEKEKCWVV